MANTQTTVPLFVANAVLTAAQQNISAGTGVPVFATTVTRDAAFGGANKALAKGQLAYIEATDIVQYYNGTAWATLAPTASKVAQIVTSRYATATDSSTSTYADTGLSVTITPTLNTSTILVMVNQGGVQKSNANTGTGISLKLFRGATDLITWAAYIAYTGTAVANFVGSATMDYLDSPATTSATTYKTQFASTTNTATATVQSQSTASTITAIELLA